MDLGILEFRGLGFRDWGSSFTDLGFRNLGFALEPRAFCVLGLGLKEKIKVLDNRKWLDSYSGY